MTKSQFLPTSSADSIQIAAEQLMAGHLVAFPTETVYGLGADATNEGAVMRIYEVKGRPTNHPLIVHVASIKGLDVWAQEIPDYALDLAHAYWPGPMTLILKRRKIAKDFITGSQNSVGIRVPSNPIALELLARFESIGGLGIAAPSANRFGRVSPTSAKDVQDDIGDYLSESDAILEGSESEIGIESTIIDCRNLNPVILRPGSITTEMLGWGDNVNSETTLESGIRVSGILEKHYAPNTKVILNKIPKPGQAFIALSKTQTPEGVYRILSPDNMDDFVRGIYSAMRNADQLGFTELVIEVPVGRGLEVALLDRVTKAAKGR